MKRYIVTVIIILFIVFSFAPMFYELSRRNEVIPARGFELVHNYVTDYHFYLSRIRLGWEGKWLVTERYTSEPHAPSFIQEFYLLLGHTVRLIPDSLVAVTAAYHGARFIFGIMFFYMAWLFIKRLIRPFIWQISALLLVITASSWPIFVTLPDGMFLFGAYMSWWTVMDSFQRATFLPHLTLSTTLMVFLVYSLTNAHTRKNWRHWIVLGITALVLGIVFPPGLVFIGVVLGFYCIIEYFMGGYGAKKIGMAQFLKEYIVPIGIVFLCSLPALLYYQHMLTIVPWKRLVEFDELNPTYINTLEYIQALGPTLPLGIMGILVALIKKDRVMTPMISWTIAWISLFWLFHYIPKQSPLRFTEMATNVPLGIMTAYFCYQLTILKIKKRNLILIHGARFIAYILSFTVIGLGVGWWLSSNMWHRMFINTKVLAGYPALSMNNYIVYPIRSIMDGIKFLEQNTPADATILSGYPAGNNIPAYAGRIVYLGHDNTVDREKKEIAVSLFFKHALTSSEALKWIRQERISYVFVGPQELEWVGETPITKYYPFLTPVFTKDFVTIYKVTET